MVVRMKKLCTCASQSLGVFSYFCFRFVSWSQKTRWMLHFNCLSWCSPRVTQNRFTFEAFAFHFHDSKNELIKHVQIWDKSKPNLLALYDIIFKAKFCMSLFKRFHVNKVDIHKYTNVYKIMKEKTRLLKTRPLHIYELTLMFRSDVI